MPKKQKKAKVSKKATKPKKELISNEFSGSETKIIKEMVNTLSSKNSYTGYYFIINDVVHPVFYDDYLKPNCKIKDAWNYLCKTWLNDLYSRDLTDLMPYVLRGKVGDSSITIGLNSDFYIEEVKKTFRIQNGVKIKIDKNLAISTKISKDTFNTLIVTLQQGIPYFEHLPWDIRLKLRATGPKEQRDEALYQILQKASKIIEKKAELKK